MLPKRDGLWVCRQIRARGALTPILLLTALDAVESRIQGLDSGADDYLTKPFAFGELLARLRAIIRRGTRPIVPEILTVADLTIDTRTREAKRGQRAIRLTAREYALLEFFARRPGEVIGRPEIAEHVWDEQYDQFSNVIDVYVQRLRRKLDVAGERPLIVTRRGEGYVFGQ
jgi:two-component system copper resistance phosphate regulon response regulator CusR